MQNNNGHLNGKAKEQQRLPQNIEAEKAVLGGILIDPDSFYEVSHFLSDNHFYSQVNGQIFKACGDLLKAQKAIDVLTVAEMCKHRNVDTTDLYIIDLINAVPTSINTEHYARIVEAAAIQRNLYHAANRIASSALKGGTSPMRLVEEAEKAIFKVSDKLSTNGMQNIKDIMLDLYDSTLERQQNGGELVGIPTGLNDLDRILRGLKRQRLYILAARPGMGKSAGANEIALSFAKRGLRVGIFNLEMGAEEIAQRFIANMAGLDLSKVEEGRLSDAEWVRFSEFTGQLSNLPIFIDDTPTLSPVQLRAKARRVYAEHGLDLIITDYLQLMTGDSFNNNRVQEISDITRSLKIISKTLDIPVLALSQLSRSLESRAEKRPLLSDLRDSGSIEQDADAVIFLYRDEYYTKEACETPNVAEWIVAKHRGGKTGKANVYWDGSRMRFRNLESRQVNL